MSGAGPSIEPELRQFLETLSADAQRHGSVLGDIVRMRYGAERARLPWQEGGPPMTGERVEGLGMPALLYRPEGVLRPPVLVYLHGGGWMLLNAATHDRLLREYVAASDWAVLAPNYPLAPEAPFPAALEACADLIDRVRDRANDLALDTGTLVLGGDSSGGNLALGVAFGGTPLDGLLLNYPVLDDDLSRASYTQFGAPPHILSADRMAFFWDSYCPVVSRADPRAAPLRAADAQLATLPPSCMTIPALDVLADENEALAARLTDLGCDPLVLRYPAATHAFLEAVAVSPSAKAAVAQTGAWLHGLGRAAKAARPDDLQSQRVFTSGRPT